MYMYLRGAGGQTHKPTHIQTNKYRHHNTPLPYLGGVKQGHYTGCPVSRGSTTKWLC